MIDQAPEREDPRLAKAGEIFAFLRQNPVEANRDPDDLAAQFGVDPMLIDRLLRSKVIADRRVRKPRFSLKKFLKEVGSLIGRAVKAVTVHPYAFLGVTSLLYVITAAFSVASVKVTNNVAAISFDGGLAAVSGVLYLAAQMLCLFVRPRFKYLLAATTLTAVSFGIFLGVVPIPEHLPIGRPLLVVIGAVAGFIGIGFLGTFFVLVGAGIEVGAARGREAHLSRQELLARMFDLEAQLAELPSSPPKSPNPLFRKVRASLFQWSVLVGLVFTTLSLAADNHLRSHPLQSVVRNQALGMESFATLLWLVSTCILAYVAGSLRRGLIVALSLGLGGLVAYAILIPLHRIPGLTLNLAIQRDGGETAFHAALVAVVLYGVFIQRELARLRLEGTPNEASVVAELVDVRHRLAAASVQVYVMAVDVVGSTKMKEGADPFLAEFSFRSSQEWVAEIAAHHGGQVDAMTGDGAIVAFGSAQNALACALDLQSKVGTFNQTKNRLKTPFRYRVSLHAGLVVGELDKVQFTEVIDVAAHVEKLSPIGGFAATLDFLRELSEPPVGVRQGPVMDGKQVYLCEPSAMSSPKG